MEKGGIKYGLTLPKKFAQKNQKVAKKELPKAPSAFLQDGDDGENIEDEIARQAIKKRSQHEVESMHAAALAQDATIFDYDAAYDEMKDSKNTQTIDLSKPRESRYIGRLIEKAKLREKEQEIVRERLLIKERAKEDHLYGDKERFVTRAYREKLKENEMWLLQEKKREAEEEANDVTKKSDLSDFYRNLLTKNVAFGNEKSMEAVKGSPATESKGSKFEARRDGSSLDFLQSNEPKSDSRDNNVKDSQSPGVDLEDTAPVDSDSERVKTSEFQKIESPVTHDDKASTVFARDDNAPPRTRKSDVESARERYLARKKQRK